ncbi:uncharacterized protein N7477_008577 [Penicillium maclennaniae]|uniref:uncharacterized protein n=1 Tax=Penicillium maclennaniae TaxID=1343394 RepID=UPI0025425165|nr:uncharacterized protein N7477_008577 [Penicillium maclennaniae]KAJ5666129.1 hypothetical protein N7477_008577 [Penicillium maclennaniae]
MNGHTSVPSRLYQAESVQLDDFKQICSRTIETFTYPLACAVERNVPIYDLAVLEARSMTAETPSLLQDEWHHILHIGPGIFVLNILSATNSAFDRIIAKERAYNISKGDHFAAGGINDRIWNAFQKHGEEDLASFLAYYSNPWLATVCNAWLSPDYRITAQFLTLQGAVAHTGMPADSGPTRFLPFSQTYAPGYLAWRRPDFRAFFQENYVALPLNLGDGIFFSTPQAQIPCPHRTAFAASQTSYK